MKTCRIFRLTALTLGVCLLLAGCSAVSFGTEEATPRLDVAAGGKTIPTLPESTAYIPEEYADKIIQENYAVFERAYALTIENVRAYSQALVSGVVTGYTNVIVGDPALVQSPWTIIHLCDVKVLSGEAEVAADGTFDIYVYGGYIPLRAKLRDSIDAHGRSMTDEELDKIVIHEVYDGAELPALGESYAFYLTWRESGEPHDCYTLTGESYSQLYIQDDCYVRRGYADEGVQVFTAEELLLD